MVKFCSITYLVFVVRQNDEFLFGRFYIYRHQLYCPSGTMNLLAIDYISPIVFIRSSFFLVNLLQNMISKAEYYIGMIHHLIAD